MLTGATKEKYTSLLGWTVTQTYKMQMQVFFDIKTGTMSFLDTT